MFTPVTDSLLTVDVTVTVQYHNQERSISKPEAPLDEKFPGTVTLLWLVGLSSIGYRISIYLIDI